MGDLVNIFLDCTTTRSVLNYFFFFHILSIIIDKSIYKTWFSSPISTHTKLKRWFLYRQKLTILNWNPCGRWNFGGISMVISKSEDFLKNVFGVSGGKIAEKLIFSHISCLSSICSHPKPNPSQLDLKWPLWRPLAYLQFLGVILWIFCFFQVVKDLWR